MVFAVAMTFIDQTIVAIAIPNIEKQLSLSETSSQWLINGYLLSLSALFAFGGKLGDVLGRRRMVVIGVIGFAVASAACGFTPKGSIAATWIIGFRIVQGATAAVMFPAAVAIVVASFPLRERGRAMAIFFGISGGLTAIGPIAGGFLTQWTWRSIFWINVPVALIALYLIWRSQPDDERHPAKLDYRGTQRGAEQPRAAPAPPDLPRPGVRRGDDGARPHVSRVHPVLLLRQRADAVNRAPATSYSEVTGITQTARNFGATLGLAIMGAVLISRNETNVSGALTKAGVPGGVAHGAGWPPPRTNRRSPPSIPVSTRRAEVRRTRTGRAPSPR